MFTQALRVQIVPLVCGMLLIVNAGCSGNSAQKPELAEVTGTVTLDGKPLSDAIIDFFPQSAADKSQSRASSAATDTEGKYTLRYDNNTTGAIPGEHLVRISKPDGEAEVAGPETLPARYNEQTTLQVTVSKTAPNQIDFDLKSK
ncbi:MAG: carboxypeptidase-like regulatory domain-containing protein [Gimesia chilikensis]|uniref:carboxypeptidase-like regulatory domain-containing protein n=1 Tax=Gimesia chilikensis TaxID=2605989 RepID=UPI0037AF31FC